MRTWRLQDAKNLSELVKAVIHQGPQEIILKNGEPVVILSKKEYNELVKPKLSFVEFLRQSPLALVKLNLKRDSSLTRKVRG